MGKANHRVLPGTDFNLLPESLIISDLLAIGADGNESMEGFDTRQGLMPVASFARLMPDQGSHAASAAASPP
jgi:hypothetical protein